MTTIAYKDNIIAFDSRATRGNMVADDDCIKRASSNGVEFFFSGCLADVDHLIKGYFERVPVDKSADICALIVCNGVVFKGGIDKGIYWGQHAHKVDAIGSGSSHALTAMDCGLSAKDAVKMAMKRDTCTGGKIRTYKVKP